MMIEQTRQMLAHLKLSGILESLELRLAEATSQGWGHSDFLAAIITDEKTFRDSAHIKRRIKTARFRIDACFEKIDTTSKRNLSAAQVRDLMELNFLKEPSNVLIQGPTGVGKTYLATALGNQACRRGYNTIFVGIHELIEKLEVARTEGSYLRLRDRLIKTECLILDDLGIKKLPASVVQDFYDILEERFSTRSTIITSQIPLENWKEVIEDPVALEAILDRLIHGAIRLKLEGESMRKKRVQTKGVDTH